jgi:hypothetical protein
MNKNQWHSRIGGAVLVLSLLFGIGLALSTTAQGQNPNDRDAQGPRDGKERRGRNWDGYGNYGGSFQLRQTALNAGYNEGIKQGHDDRNRSNRSDYRDRGAYKKATKDYNNRLGDRETYRRYYREAYGTGYGDGVNGY